MRKKTLAKRRHKIMMKRYKIPKKDRVTYALTGHLPDCNWLFDKTVCECLWRVKRNEAVAKRKQRNLVKAAKFLQQEFNANIQKMGLISRTGN